MPQLQNTTVMSALIRRYPAMQLATLVDQPPVGGEWLHEIKFDGYRLFGFVSGGESRLRTRNGQDWTGRFPSLTAALEKLAAKDAVLDMEAVVLDGQGKSSFQALQAALGEGGHASRIVAYAFDLLDLDGEDLTTLPLKERKEKLRELVGDSQKGAIRYSKHIGGRGTEMFAEACEKGLEGIISKEAGASYVTGRSKSWVKTKCLQRQEFIILGYSNARTGERALGALYLGYRQNGEVRYAGKVGTGFSMKSARELAQRFAKLALQKPTLTRAETAGVPANEWQAIHWIKPVLLGEVAFTEWTQDGRIRHPSFQGLREVKMPAR
jgi:bifunctional non-homologous end joining protein LigD